MTLELCPNNYCGNNKNLIDGDCHDLDQGAGSKIVIQADGMPRCYCVCSCLAVDMPIATPTGTIKVQDIVASQTEVLAAGRDLKFQPFLVTQASGSAPGVTEHTIYLHYQLEDTTKRELIVSRDHVFLLTTGVLVRADNLQVVDQLVDQNGNSVQILEVAWGSYDGVFYEFATKMEQPDPNLTGHLVLTNDVISGDFAVQAFVNLNSPQHTATAASTALPLAHVQERRSIVGSPEWREANAASSSALSSSAASAQSTGLPTPAAETPKKMNTGTFTPASLRKIKIPDHASNFLPPQQAAFLQLYAPKVDYNDPYNHQMGNYIEKLFSAWYPDVTYLFDWYSDEVNSHSWVEDGKKYVLLVGGLARISGFDFEGLCLAVAHELGHLCSKLAEGDSGTTCEGEADYWGSKIVLRKVWFGEYYIDNTLKAIEQTKTLLGYLRLPIPGAPAPTTEQDKTGRDYPSISCRFETFKAAMALAVKPPCADCSGEVPPPTPNGTPA